MKRTPLQRRKALKRTPFPKRTKPMRRTPASRSQTRKTGNGIPTDVSDAVRARSGGICEWPSCPDWATEMHHLLMRSQGGPHTEENLRDLCGAHHGMIHANPADSYESGWLIRGVGRQAEGEAA